MSMTDSCTISGELFWQQTEPEGNCACCGDTIFLAAMQGFVRVIMDEKPLGEFPLEPTTHLCCACFDAMGVE